MSTEGNESTAVDTQGDLQASHNAGDAFNNFADTIERVVAAALAEVGLGIVPMQPMSPWDIPFIPNQVGGLGVDPETGLPIQGPVEAPVPVDVAGLNSQVSSLEGQVTALEGNVSSIRSEVKGAFNEAISRSTTAQQDASEAQGMARKAISVAQKALSKAGSSGNSAVEQSDAETPSYVTNGGGPQ